MTILCYHSVEPGWDSPLAIAPAAFEAHCRWLSAHREVIPLGDAVVAIQRSGRLPRGRVAITFDDGLSGVYEHAFPILQRHRLSATVFLVGATLVGSGQPVDWVDTPPAFPLRTMSRAQVQEMASEGFDFQSHSMRHHDLTRLRALACEADLLESRLVLEDLLQRPVNYLAYPRGRHDEAVRRSAERAGYTQAFSLPEGVEPTGAFAIPRVGVYPGNGTRAMMVKTSRWYTPVRTSRALPALRGMWRAVARTGG